MTLMHAHAVVLTMRYFTNTQITQLLPLVII